MRTFQSILVTGGAGFIGSAFIRFLFSQVNFQGKVINLDLLTYAGNLSLCKSVSNHPRYRFVQGNILDQPLIESLLQQEKIDAIVHFAAETHVDRSILSSLPFIETNIKGTWTLLEAVRKFREIHFHHISTDEVYGALGESGTFNELSPYRPNSPYAASKAASDHLVRSYATTYNLSTTISHCSNNYGPGQYREKFIPLMITHALEKKPLPIYGRGTNVRDWLYVDDHVEGIWRILTKGRCGETYDLGGDSEQSNLDLLRILLNLLSKETKEDYIDLIAFVADRPGHDFRYAIDSKKIREELGWKARVPLEKGLRKTISSYLSALRDLEPRHLCANDWQAQSVP
jgi:dTDP-glucose 4,6-dehydratase